MLLGRMIAPVRTLGPGKRVVVWVQGCSKHCKGCISEELQLFDKTKDIPLELLGSIIESEAKRNDCDSLTISGGDPFEQAEELFLLLRNLRSVFMDILVYTGYTFDEINKSEKQRKCLKYIDVLIDGKYVEERNTGSSILCGSDNQRIIILNPSLIKRYKDYEQQERKIEVFLHKDKAIMVGIQGGDE